MRTGEKLMFEEAERVVRAMLCMCHAQGASTVERMQQVREREDPSALLDFQSHSSKLTS